MRAKSSKQRCPALCLYSSKLRRISQMCCNQVRNTIAYVNTREKIRILSSHCSNKMHYCSTIT